MLVAHDFIQVFNHSWTSFIYSSVPLDHGKLQNFYCK